MALHHLPTTLSGATRQFACYPSPRILAALVLGCLAGRIALGAWSPWDAVVALALLGFWPLQEWLIHVFLLHYEPVSLLGRRWDFDLPRKHRAHHRDPSRLELIFIPLHVYLYAPLLVAGVAFVFASSLPRVLSFLSGYFLLALHYEWVHFLVHTRYRPRSARYQRLRRNHRLHHFRNEHYWYGVTMLSGDRLMHTAPLPDAVPTSPTARTLRAG